MRHQCLCKIMQKSVSKYGVQLKMPFLESVLLFEVGYLSVQYGPYP